MSDHVMELRRRAAAGDALSQFRLARLLLIGHEVAPDPQLAVRLLRDASAQSSRRRHSCMLR